MDTRPSVCHPTSKKINFLKSVAFPKKRCILPHLAHVSDLSHPQARRRALRVPLGSTRPTTRAARPVRHTKTDDVHLTSRSAQRRRSFPSPSTSKFSSLPSITISVTPCRTTRKPDDGARRDFACTSTWPHDGALPKHGAPRAASGRVVNLPATRPNFGSLRLPKLTIEKLRNSPKLPKLPKLTKFFV